MAKLPMNYDNYVFDLYGTLVDIRTDENLDFVWEKLALFYGYYKALYTPDELKEAYGRLVDGKEKEMKARMSICCQMPREFSRNMRCIFWIFLNTLMEL